MALPLVPILGIAGALIDKIFPDPQEKARAQAALQKAQLDGELAHVEKQMSAIVMEAQSKDPWTSRARPSFLYVIYIYVLSAIPFGFLFAFNPETAGNVTTGVSAWLEAIPGEMWSLFGVGYLGYTGFRSYDKRKLIDNKSLFGK